MAIVIDASVALAWCFPDEDSPLANRVLDLLKSEEAMVPSVWPLEVANALVSAERRARITETDLVRAWDVLLALPLVEVQLRTNETISGVLPVARANGLSVYDASYVHLAQRESLPLATLDRRLLAAAEAAGCAVFE